MSLVGTLRKSALNAAAYGRLTRSGADGYVGTGGRARWLTRHGQRSFATVAVVGVALLSGLASLATGPTEQVTPPPPDGPFLGWEPWGDELDTGAVAQARDVWEEQDGNGLSESPYTHVRPLLATRQGPAGLVVILQARDADQRARLGIFTSADSQPEQLRLRADRPVPDPETTKLVTLVSARLGTDDGRPSVSGRPSTVALALGMPGVTDIRASSTTVDQELHEAGSPPRGRFAWHLLPPGSTGLTTTITAYAGTSQVAAVRGDGARHDAEPVQARVQTRMRDGSGDTITAVVSDITRVRAGQLAVTPHGLVGRVTAVDAAHREVSVRPATAPASHVDARTAISDHRGVLAGAGDRLSLRRLDPRAGVRDGNRVVMSDPAQGHRHIGAVTAGHVVSDQEPGAATVTVQPAVSPDEPDTFWIMTPPVA